MSNERLGISLDSKVREKAYECANFDGYRSLSAYLTMLINKDFEEKEVKIERYNNQRDLGESIFNKKTEYNCIL